MLQTCGNCDQRPSVLSCGGDLPIPARTDAGVDMRQSPLGPGPRPDNGGDANKENHEEDDPMEGKSDQMSKFDWMLWKGICWDMISMKQKAVE